MACSPFHECLLYSFPLSGRRGGFSPGVSHFLPATLLPSFWCKIDVRYRILLDFAERPFGADEDSCTHGGFGAKPAQEGFLVPDPLPLYQPSRRRPWEGLPCA